MKRLVGTVDVCGLPFRVYLVDDKAEPELKGNCYGLCDRFTQTISLNVAYSVAIRRETLSHEMLHGIWALSGVNTFIRKAKNPWDREELVIMAISPHVLRAEASARKLNLR